MKQIRIFLIVIFIVFILVNISCINLLNASKLENKFTFKNNGFRSKEFIIKLKKLNNATLFLNDNKNKYDIISMENKLNYLSNSNILLKNIYLIRTTEDEYIQSMQDEFSHYSFIEYIEPNYLRYADYLPNDAYFGNQWALFNTGQYKSTLDADIDATDSWNITTGNGKIIVAVIDTGVDYTHPDLINNIWMNEDEISNNNIDDDQNGYIDDTQGWDFHNNDNNPMDDYGHGTQCSGIIAAEGDNNIGIAGLCWNVNIMPIKALAKNGYGDVVSITESIIYATDNGADVISMSLGSSISSILEEEAIDYAYSNGVIIVASAGNDNNYDKHYPAGYENVIAVSSVDNNYNKSYFSNKGDWIDVAAPGENIISTYPGNYYLNISGTSASAPFVSGLSALILTRNSNLSNQDVRNLIRNNTDTYNPIRYIGTGVINSYKSLLQIENIPPLKPDKPFGSSEGEINKYINFSTTGFDPNSDKLYFFWNWGDGNYSGWIGPYSYGDICFMNHSWSNSGNYSVIVKSKDYLNSESDWSDPLTIKIPKIKIYNKIPKILLWLFEFFPFIQLYFSNYL